MSDILKVLSLFSGIGTFEMALNELDIDWELDHYCEIDKFASKSYNQIHNTTDEYNLKDVKEIDCNDIGDIDLITYGFPCQDISVAGSKAGFYDDDNQLTRSGLFFNAAEIIEKIQPKFAIFENVKNLVSKTFEDEFNAILSTLNDIGYTTYYQVLNSKYFGVPQNRERVLGVSIRKDIDRGFDFPKGDDKCSTCIKDILCEDAMNKNFLLNDEYVDRFIKSTLHMGGDIHIIGTTVNPKAKGTNCRHWVHDINGIVGALSATDYKQPKQILDSEMIQIGQIYGTNNNSNPQGGRIYSIYGISPSMDTCNGGNRMPKIVDSVNSGYCGVLRKFSPKECWRLMGIKDCYFDKIQDVSNKQLYKQAGNAIVVNVLVAIFDELLKQYPEYFKIKGGVQ